VIGASSARHCDITSVNRAATAALLKGPALAACKRRNTCASRSGRSTVFLEMADLLRKRCALINQLPAIRHQYD